MAELKASPRNKYVGKVADVLRSIRDTGDEVQLPVLGGLGSLFLGKSPEEINEWSYGNAPMQLTSQGDRLPKMKRGRGPQVADTAFAAMDLPALRALTAAAGRPLARALEDSPLTRAAEFVGEQRTPVSAVVKPKGGNWLSGSVEDALKGLKRDYGSITGQPHPEAQSLNSWIEGPLTKYVKTRMASPEDEVRKLAEEGILHIPQPRTEGYYIAGNREKAGFPAAGLGKSELAKGWEYVTDSSINPLQAKDFFAHGRSPGYPDTVAKNPWLTKVAPETQVYEQLYATTGPMGFDHLIDELSNALNPASGLPRNLQLTPEAVKNMSMEKAVRLVADINAHRAAQKVEANRKLAEQASVVREYADDVMPNPKGLRWVELKQNVQPNPENWGQMSQAERLAMIDAREAAERQALADQLKYEGDTMGHCVGGYCDDVLSGRSRIFSLRDAKGEPHVTIEVNPAKEFGQRKAAFEAEYGRPPNDLSELEEWAQVGDGDFQNRIVQIKGKQNRAPNAEYLPFVQDFVRNSPLGQPWSDVGDLENTGLIRRSTLDPAELRKAAPNQEWFTQPEIDALYDDVRKGIAEGKFASGGPVTAARPSWDIFTDN